MGLIKYGPLAEEVSGTVGGVTFARSHDAKTCRAWRAPANKRATLQRTLRRHLAIASSRWFEVLTQTQRDNWNLYTVGLKFTNALGEQYEISGFNMFVRNQAAALHFGLGYITNCPSTQGFPPQYDITWKLTHSTGLLQLFDIDPVPPTADQLLVTIHQLQKASRAFPDSPRIWKELVDTMDVHPLTVYTYSPTPPGSAGDYAAHVTWRYWETATQRMSIPYKELVVSV